MTAKNTTDQTKELNPATNGRGTLPGYSDFPLVFHPTFLACYKALYKDSEDVGEIDDDTPMGGNDAKGKEVEFTFRDIREAQEEAGLYGFANPDTGAIDLWVAEDYCDIHTLMDFFAHELTHLFFDRVDWSALENECRAAAVSDDPEDPAPEAQAIEIRACRIGAIAVLAFRLATRVLDSLQFGFFHADALPDGTEAGE